MSLISKLVASPTDPENKWYLCQCHCGATAFKIAHKSLESDSSSSPEPAPVVNCSCSICTVNGYLLIYVFKEQVRFIRGWDDLKAYEFASKTRKHKFCGVCGTSVAIDFLDLVPEGNVIGVNARVIQGLDLKKLNLMPLDGRAYQAEYNREIKYE
ncbi:hypothetical protein jhhlp_008202 [Lomentospora prolificans]|uniref:CENP-V/GFA domain-containing protein n=1 Tax=Lomentospora prolificans TaxID=41688 RepID=A0A2N3MZC5_9PEZI|nr:hypothetical protein jhhlp_008202 [Lomentospora prolificans]